MNEKRDYIIRAPSDKGLPILSVTRATSREKALNNACFRSKTQKAYSPLKQIIGQVVYEVPEEFILGEDERGCNVVLTTDESKMFQEMDLATRIAEETGEDSKAKCHDIAQEMLNFYSDQHSY